VPPPPVSRPSNPISSSRPSDPATAAARYRSPLPQPPATQPRDPRRPRCLPPRPRCLPPRPRDMRATLHAARCAQPHQPPPSSPRIAQPPTRARASARKRPRHMRASARDMRASARDPAPAQRAARSRPCLLPHAAQPPQPPPSSPRSARPPPTPRNAARSRSRHARSRLTRSRPQPRATQPAYAAATRAAASILTTMRDPRRRMRMSRFVSAACKQPCPHPPPPDPRLPYNISARSCLTPSKYTPRNLPHPIHHLRLIFSPTSLPTHDWCVLMLLVLNRSDLCSSSLSSVNRVQQWTLEKLRKEPRKEEQSPPRRTRPRKPFHFRCVLMLLALERRFNFTKWIKM
jgi:hypothetical protein